jgi:hypothetical protein
MKLEIITATEFAGELGFAFQNNVVAPVGVAILLRRALARWGLAPRRVVVSYVRKQIEGIEATEPDSAQVGKILDQLLAIGECDEVLIAGERYIASGLPRWVPITSETGVLLSVADFPSGIQVLDSGSPDNIVRRISVEGDDAQTALFTAGVRRCEFNEWLGPLAYLPHARRRFGHPVRDDNLTLKGFWDLLVQHLLRDGRQLSGEAEVRILSGLPGSYFGSYTSPSCEGRWVTEEKSGIWCAYRRGFGDHHWHPIIISIEEERRLMLDLYNRDEWLWALLARGHAFDSFEMVFKNDTAWQLSFPVPSQLGAALDIVGPRIGPWKWNIPNIGEALWSSMMPI